MYKAKDHVVWRHQDDLLVVLDTNSGHYYTLNQVAMELWLGLVERELTLDQAVEAIQEKFSEAPDPQRVRQECLEMIEQFQKEDLIAAL